MVLVSYLQFSFSVPHLYWRIPVQDHKAELRLLTDDVLLFVRIHSFIHYLPFRSLVHSIHSFIHSFILWLIDWLIDWLMIDRVTRCLSVTFLEALPSTVDVKWLGKLSLETTSAWLGYNTLLYSHLYKLCNIHVHSLTSPGDIPE